MYTLQQSLLLQPQHEMQAEFVVKYLHVHPHLGLARNIVLQMRAYAYAARKITEIEFLVGYSRICKKSASNFYCNNFNEAKMRLNFERSEERRV